MREFPESRFQGPGSSFDNERSQHYIFFYQIKALLEQS